MKEWNILEKTHWGNAYENKNSPPRLISLAMSAKGRNKKVNPHFPD